MQKRGEELWEKAGGDMRLKDTGYGKEEMDRRLTGDYARSEVEKYYSESNEWKAIRRRLESGAIEEAERRESVTKKALDEVTRELKERAPEKKMADLDDRLAKGGYSVGSAGFSMLADAAREVIKLEQEYSGVDEQEATERHPKAAATLEQYAEYKRRDRGLGR
jgi:gamma-glutamyl:cysteine ligase YbdK (ATP-grasp superfamily)